MSPHGQRLVVIGCLVLAAIVIVVYPREPASRPLSEPASHLLSEPKGQQPDCDCSSSQSDHNPIRTSSESLQQWFTAGKEEFDDVQGLVLSPSHVQNARLLTERHAILPLIAKNGIVGEVGTQTGRFAADILRVAQPRKLHIMDIDFTNFEKAKFSSSIEDASVVLHQGDSSTLLASFPDHHFDFLYIDGDHSYNGVQRDLQQAAKKAQTEWLARLQ